MTHITLDLTHGKGVWNELSFERFFHNLNFSFLVKVLSAANLCEIDCGKEADITKLNFKDK